jgi:hypothetical protein
MIKNIFTKTLGALCIGLAFASCTDRFEEFNTNPNGITERDLENTVPLNDLIKGNLRVAQQSIYVFNPAWYTQVQQNLNADIFSGYMMTPTPFAGNSNNTTYALVDGWNLYAFQPGYEFVLTALKKVDSKIAGQAEYNDVYAISKILQVEAMHRIADAFGPIVYRNAGVFNPDGTVEYDTQEEAYDAFFADLSTAIDILEDLSGDPPSTLISESDLVYGGDYSKWLKFANSLRLRLAIRISKVAPDKAKSQGEAALGNSGGLIAANSESFSINLESYNHPLNVFNNEWADIRFGAPMSSIMNGYDDPRLSHYAEPAEDAAVAGDYIGIRQGINIDAKSRYQGYSALTTFGNKVDLMNASEVWFLKAEAALRGWTGAGDEQTNYEKGIELSLAQYGESASYAAYVSDATSVPAEYIDPKAIEPGQNDIETGDPNLSTVTIAWNDGDSDEKKLEKIITQKWIAMYPEGQEAWSEVRRTGYPKLFPVLVNNSGGKIQGFIKRLPIPALEYATNSGAVKRVFERMGSEDSAGSPVWWDVD